MSQVIEKAETGSTNDDAKRLAVEGAPHLTVVWDHPQVPGRRRHDRAWSAPEGNVYWSVIVRPQPGWPPVANLVYVNALAVLGALEAVTGPAAGLCLRGPNDGLLNARNVAGPLHESAGGPGHGPPPWVVMGTGINVREHPEDPDMRYPATSLHREGDTGAQREAVAALAAPGIATGFPAIRDAYLRHAHALGETIRVGLSRDRREYVDGVYRGIDGHGALLLERADGSTVTLHSGDVILSA